MSKFPVAWAVLACCLLPFSAGSDCHALRNCSSCLQRPDCDWCGKQTVSATEMDGTWQIKYWIILMKKSL